MSKSETITYGETFGIPITTQAETTKEFVEVVRCKNCKSRPHYIPSPLQHPTYTSEVLVSDGMCPFRCTGRVAEIIHGACWLVPPDDFFCGWGEPKDGE